MPFGGMRLGMTESVARRLVDTRVVIETPEGVDFRFRIAGPGQRLWAWCIDSLIKAGSLAILWLFLLSVGHLVVRPVCR